MIMKRVIIVFCIIIVLLLGGGLFAGNYLYDLAMNNTIDKGTVFGAEHNAIASDELEESKQEKIKNEQWLVDTGYTNEYITAFDDLRLHAYQIMNEKRKNKWVVICHGYASHAKSMLNAAKQFYNMGFNVLLPDARGLGESEGDYIGMGWHERRDIVQWTAGIVANHPQAEIVLYGVSMGGATVMMASGEADLAKNVKVVVEDCGYSSVKGEFAYQLNELFGLPAFPLLNFASIMTKIRAGFWIGEADVTKQLNKSNRPTLFIHGDADTFVPYSMLDEVYNALDAPKEKFIVHGAGHSGAEDADRTLYWETVGGFIQQYI